MGGTRTNRAGIIGITFSVAYEWSVGGVTKGSENIADMFSTPRSFPSITYIAAKPNKQQPKHKQSTQSKHKQKK